MNRCNIFLVTSLLFVSACGGGGGGGSTAPAPTPAPPATDGDLSVTVSAPAASSPDSTIDFTVVAVNNGPATISNVTVQATVTGSVDVSAISDSGTEAAGVVRWPAIASLANGARQEFTLTLSPTAEGDVSVNVSGTTTTTDNTQGNNDGSAVAALATTTVANTADIAVVQAGGGGFDPGAPLTLTVTVENAGPDEALDVSVTSTIAGSLPITAISDGGTQSGTTITWPDIATMAAGDTVTFTVSAAGPLTGPVDVRASATSTTPDADPSNNDGSAGAALARIITTFATIRTINGESAGDQFGWLMENLGDLDADGVDDFAVTAPANDDGGADAGKVYVYSGATGSLVRSVTGTAGERFGAGVDLAGDINGDGTGDLIVGAPGGATGRAVIYSGANGAQLRSIAGPTAGEQFGFAVARAGDVNNDQVDDVIVGAPSAAGGGRAYVYSGANGTLLQTLTPAAGGAGFGSSVGGPGDLNGDNFDDLLVGAPNTGGGGRVYVLSGASGAMLYPSIAPDATGGSLGNFWLESPGDLDSDGVPDIFAADITNRALGSNSGRAYVYSGATGETIHVLDGTRSGEQFGIGRGADDANGDGIRDIFVAGWLSSEGASTAGKGYLFSGGSGALLRTFTSTTAGENLGFDAVSIGDVDGDGVPDYLLSGGISGTTSGRVLVVKGVAIP